MSKNLVIVESPAKSKTIKKFMGSDYKIEASMGHIRDLPKSQLGVDVENDFEPKYITIRGKGELLKTLRKEAKNADKIYLATDPDREGEAISWHLLQALNLEDKKISRITFNEITKEAVKRSIKEARDIDMDLVDAQQARRVLDRIVGYKISSLLWKKIKGGLSAGRVQSVALRIICDREEEIRNFVPEEYWTIDAKLENSKKEKFIAKFYGNTKRKIDLKNEKQVNKILDELKGKKYIVDEIKETERARSPYPPFTTSTLQQEASRVLGITTQKAMMIAQQLYEGVNIKGEGTVGLISYIRTDSVRISDEAWERCKEFVNETYGKEYLPKRRPVYKTKGRAQDAHEAIRPTSVVRTPASIKESLTNDQFKLYKLIWERFVASQMAPAIYHVLSVKISAGDYIFKAAGSQIIFKGFLEVYGNIKEDDMLPELKEKEVLKLNKIMPEQHFTQPPSRYSDAALVKTLEEIGVGRPSTYAPTLSTILARNYVVKEKKLLCPTELGETVNSVMKEYFPNIADMNFTADMEADLDKVEEGELNWKDIIRNFYPDFEKTLESAAEKMEKVELKPEETDVICEKCGRHMVVKFGRYGKFLACPGYPECRNTKPFLEEAGVDCPLCGGKVLIKKTKKGRVYYGCENNPECEFMTWNKPAVIKCPICGSYMLEKGNKVVCANEKCGHVIEKDKKKTSSAKKK
ncbi:MAG: type I DNA topoisomerase [Firmicutes bacterium]|nr:type I DNA topoisomerase [Bacillota bacterium]MBR0105555.1 type I DNA topoisomerase [Bacillota bacterium]